MGNKKGFTLVELLVSIVIIGVISAMSFPMISRIQGQSSRSKYATYADSLVAASKLYVDTYGADLFFYDDDIASMSSIDKDKYADRGDLKLDESHNIVMQCGMIGIEDLINHGLAKDIGIDNMSCISDYSFVIVKKTKNSYEYNAYLGCGTKTKKAKVDAAKVSLKVPEDIPSIELKDYCN